MKKFLFIMLTKWALILGIQYAARKAYKNAQ